MSPSASQPFKPLDVPSPTAVGEPRKKRTFRTLSPDDSNDDEAPAPKQPPHGCVVCGLPRLKGLKYCAPCNSARPSEEDLEVLLPGDEGRSDEFYARGGAERWQTELDWDRNVLNKDAKLVIRALWADGGNVTCAQVRNTLRDRDKLPQRYEAAARTGKPPEAFLSNAAIDDVISSAIAKYAKRQQACGGQDGV